MRKAPYWMYKKTKFNGHWKARKRAAIQNDWIELFVALVMIGSGIYGSDQGGGAMVIFGIIYLFVIAATPNHGHPPDRITPPIDWDKKLADMRLEYEKTGKLPYQRRNK